MDLGAAPPFQEPVWRFVQPRLGNAWISHRWEGGRPRPGLQVRVTGVRHEGMTVQVETDWGLDRQMYAHYVDFGYEFRTKAGEWIAESDPRSVRWLQRVLQELRSGVAPRHVGDFNCTLEEADVLRILRRNGCDPDGAVSERERRRRNYLGG
jgi:hypothetical protein